MTRNGDTAAELRQEIWAQNKGSGNWIPEPLHSNFYHYFRECNYLETAAQSIDGGPGVIWEDAEFRQG